MKNTPTNRTGCVKDVSLSGRMVGFYPCSNKVSVTRDGMNYCHMHDPEAIKEKRKKKDDKAACGQAYVNAKIEYEQKRVELLKAAKAVRTILDKSVDPFLRGLAVTIEELEKCEKNTDEAYQKAVEIGAPAYYMGR